MPNPATDPADPFGPATVDPGDHAAHDPLLVASYAAGDAAGAELEVVTALVAACPACATLHHDLRVIAAALPVMPAPRRTRDFRLTAEQAASLRPSGWRRLLAPFAGPRFAFAAPLGSGLAALGLVGMLLAGTGLPLGGATAGAAPADAPLAAAPPADETPAAASPASEEGQVTTTAPSDDPDMQGAVTAPEGTAGADAAGGGASTAASDKHAAGANASPEGVPGAAAGTSPPEAAEATGEAVRVMGARDQVVEHTGNIVLLGLAAAMLLAGVAMAGLRVLSRRVA
jgi:hypothetical protein